MPPGVWRMGARPRDRGGRCRGSRGGDRRTGTIPTLIRLVRGKDGALLRARRRERDCVEAMTRASDAPKVLLIGNYPHDRQESMQRFATLMLNGLTNAGVEVRLLIPRPIFGRLRPGGSGIGKWLGYLD